MSKWLKKWLSLGFIVTVIIVFVAFYSVMYFSAAQAYSTATLTEANQTYQDIQQIRQTASTTSILLNNFKVSIILLIPVIGVMWFFSVMWNTGHVVGALALATGISPFAYLLGISFPIGFLEVSAYAVLAAEIIYVVYLQATRKDVKNRLLHGTWISFILYFTLLLVAACLEMFALV